jgi:hypothetical protein
MTIVYFEGPSAVGKTTSAQVLRASNGIEVVPDVAALFERPSDESADWYLERQVERWQLALQSSVDRDVVLDGDPFQPLLVQLGVRLRGLALVRPAPGVLSTSTGSG